MKDYQHIKLTTLNFNPKKIGDLVYSEGPVLSHFIGDNGKQYFFTWVDNDEAYNRWLVFEVNNLELFLFFNNKQNLKSIVLDKDFVYFLDLNELLEPSNVQIVDRKSIPVEYLPSENSEYDKDNYEPYAEKLKAEIDHEFRFNHLIKNSLAESFSESTLILPLIESINIPSFLLFGHLQYLNTIFITLLIDSALNYELTREKKFEDIGFSIINSYRINQMPSKFMLNKFSLDSIQSDFYNFLTLYINRAAFGDNKYLYLTLLLKNYYKGLSKEKEINWIDKLEQKIVKELV